jgi:uncharacterized protein (TIGR02246 family)
MSGGRPVEEIGMTPQDLVHRLADAFNDKDADAFAALFTEDAEFVNVFGARMRGRAGIAEGDRRVFATTLVGSTLALEELDVLPLGDDVAVCHARWRRGRTADATPATLPPGEGIFTLVGRRDGDGWLLAAATNVAITAPPGSLHP